MIMFHLLSIVLLIVAWILVCPQGALDLVTDLQRQFRRYITQRAGTQAVQELAQQLRAESKQIGIPTEIADKLIEEKRQEIINRLGSNYANKVLDDK